MSPGIRKAVSSLRAYAPGEQPAGSVLKLNTNENPYPPSPAVEQALRSFSADSLRLYPDPQSTALRTELARRHGARPDQVLVGNGSDEILALCVRAFTESGGRIGYFDPSYSLYPVLAAAEERLAVPTPLGPEFEWPASGAKDSDLFFLTCPNAPTGLRYPRATVAPFCETHSGIVVLDEAYADFANDSYLDLALRLPNVLSVRTLSKSHSLAGLRLGYAIGPAELMDALNRLRDSYNVDRIAQHLALAALSDPDTMRENCRRIAHTRDVSIRRLAAMDFSTPPSETNFLWTRPPPPHTAARIFQELRNRNILVRYFDGPRTGDWLRITLGADAQMNRFFEGLAAALRGERGETENGEGPPVFHA